MITGKRLMEASWALTGVFFAKMFPLVGSILLIRIFDTDAYGRYSLTLATINLLLTATGAGLVGGLVANIAAKQGLDSEEARRQHVRSFAAVNFGLLLLVLSGSTGAALLGLLDDQLGEVVLDSLAPMLLLVVIQVQLASQSAVATVSGVLKRLAFTSLVGGILATVLQVAGGLAWGVSGALWGMALGYGTQLVLQARYLRGVRGAGAEDAYLDLRSKSTALASRAWTDFVQYGGYMFGSSVIVSVGMWLLSYSLLHGNAGMGEVAAFGVLNHWRMLLVFIPLAMANYLTSRFARQGDQSQRLRILGKSLAAASSPLIVLTAATFLFDDQILAIYGEAYAGLRMELHLTALIALLSGLNSIFGNFLTGSNLFRQGLLSNLVWFLGLVLSLIWLRDDGLDVTDACVCLLAAYVLHTAYQLAVLLRNHWAAERRATPLGT